jgi:hypothetical protein
MSSFPLQFHNGNHGRGGSVLAHYHTKSTGLIVPRPTIAGPTLANTQYQLDVLRANPSLLHAIQAAIAR